MRLASLTRWGSRFSPLRSCQRMGAWQSSLTDCRRDLTGSVSFGLVTVYRLPNMVCELSSARNRQNKLAQASGCLPAMLMLAMKKVFPLLTPTVTDAVLVSPAASAPASANHASMDNLRALIVGLSAPSFSLRGRPKAGETRV